MSVFTPGQYKKSLQEKVQGLADEGGQMETTPIQIKNNDPASFTQQASTYAANEMRQIQQSVRAPQSTASLPKESFINKSVHDRMTSLAKGQYNK